MGNEVNYIHATIFINLFHTPLDQGKKKQNPEKWDCNFFQ